MDISMGFCIESIEDQEMPETLFGAGTLNKPIYDAAPKWNPSFPHQNNINNNSSSSSSNLR